MTASPQLVSDLSQQVLLLEADLRRRVADVPQFHDAWRADYDAAQKAERTARSWVEWRDERITQVAVAWVLTTVFIRFCEDNALLRDVWISGPGGRAQEALDKQLAYFRANPEDTDREWVMQAVKRFQDLDATKALVDERSPMFLATPSGSAVSALLDFWRRRDDDGRLIHDFAAPELSTRFLGDLYQDLSESARKTYALLQTPEFVEEFILDQTLEPALKERPLEGFKLIDPACGSGHFLLGAFNRLLEKWTRKAPGLNPRELAQKGLASIHGVDINPFAVAIARFRLLVAAMKASGETSFDRGNEIDFGFDANLAAGDSLLFGAQDQLDYEGDVELGGFVYRTEDHRVLNKLLHRGQYDAVVANPPYISVKDRAQRDMYRGLYSACHGKYVLTVPFMELIFELAKPQRDSQPAGWTGQITSNSFMKREFGSKLIEEYLARKDLFRIIDTSGAYIPGHGTPTLILVGRNRAPQASTVRVVQGIQGEPGRPSDPAGALVWTSIVTHIDEAGHEGQWTSTADVDRAILNTHPWSLTGGGADELLEAVENAAVGRLDAHADSIGITSFTLEDDVYLSPPHSATTAGIDLTLTRPMVMGDIVRDWSLEPDLVALFPYSSEFDPLNVEGKTTLHRRMWPYRTRLANNKLFGGKTKVQEGLRWTEFGRLNVDKLRVPLSITFAFVATHNHFVLDRGGKVFNRSAPVIKLPEGATEDEHLELLGVLNSSTACFWMKQNSHNKGGPGGGYSKGEKWRDFYEFTGTTLQSFPVPKELPRARARRLDQLALELQANSPAAVCSEGVPSRDALDDARKRSAHLRGCMVAEQEELDWECYRLYGIIDEDLTYHGEDLPTLRVGERSFEIILARQVRDGAAETRWFRDFDGHETLAPPSEWPEGYRSLVERRLELTSSDRALRLTEHPNCKRTWESRPWIDCEREALANWLLERLEDKKYWLDKDGTPTPLSVGQLADRVERDPDLVSVLGLWEGRPDVPVAASLTKLIVDGAVPYLAALRLKESGMRKREAWEETWALQRREDAGEKGLTIPVPPNYTSADFRKQSWWQARGKLDVPKERFILYPDAGRVTDQTAVLGWAGWDHAQQALAIAQLIAAREADGASDESLIPLVAGLAELHPWVEQWHSEVDPTYGISLASFVHEELMNRARQVGQSLEQLKAWRPQPATRGRKRAR